VLLAEDVAANQMLVVRTLEKRGHLVEVAKNGREAVERVQSMKFDVILMDVQMPEMDGFQATAAVRAMGNGSYVPIIALTAHAMAGDEEKCLAAGMDGYLAKPLELAALVQAVEQYASPTIVGDGRCRK
jgi:two-component system sensor histidine kinase/response regulator